MWVYAWSEFCMGKAEDPSLRFLAPMQVEDEFLVIAFDGTF